MAGLGAVQPAAGLTALARLLHQPGSITALCPLLLPAFLQPRARQGPVFSELLQSAPTAAGAPVQPQPAASSTALPLVEWTPAVRGSTDIAAVLASIAHEVLGCAVAPEQPLMEVRRALHQHCTAGAGQQCCTACLPTQGLHSLQHDAATLPCTGSWSSKPNVTALHWQLWQKRTGCCGLHTCP